MRTGGLPVASVSASMSNIKENGDYCFEKHIQINGPLP